MLLCKHHHKAIHHRGYRVELTTTGAKWQRPDGTPVDPSAHAPPLVGPGVVEQNEALGLDITPDTAAGLWDGRPLDESWCVEGLLKSRIETAAAD